MSFWCLFDIAHCTHKAQNWYACGLFFCFCFFVVRSFSWRFQACICIFAASGPGTKAAQGFAVWANKLAGLPLLRWVTAMPTWETKADSLTVVEHSGKHCYSMRRSRSIGASRDLSLSVCKWCVWGFFLCKLSMSGKQILAITVLLFIVCMFLGLHEPLHATHQWLSATIWKLSKQPILEILCDGKQRTIRNNFSKCINTLKLMKRKRNYANVQKISAKFS